MNIHNYVRCEIADLELNTHIRIDNNMHGGGFIQSISTTEQFVILSSQPIGNKNNIFFERHFDERTIFYKKV